MTFGIVPKAVVQPTSFDYVNAELVCNGMESCIRSFFTASVYTTVLNQIPLGKFYA